MNKLKGHLLIFIVSQTIENVNNVFEHIFGLVYENMCYPFGSYEWGYT